MITFLLSDKPFTILAPKNSATMRDETLLRQPELVKKLLLDHVVLGSRQDLTNVTAETAFQTLGGKTVHLSPGKEGKLLANGAIVVNPRVEVPNGVLVVLDDYLFPEDGVGKNSTAQNKLDVGMLSVVTAKEENKAVAFNTSFVENVLEVLSFLKSGVRVFQHFLSRSNVSQLLQEGRKVS